MGSYLVVLERDGFRDVRYPVFISRNRQWTGRMNLYAEDEIGKGMVYVPAGPFIQGGGEGTRAWTLPRSEPWVDDFFIAEHPVTMEDYLEFLNDLVREAGIEEAERRAPRTAAGTYLVRDGEDLRLPEVDPLGDRWDPRMPVFAISWHDAGAYVAWLSAREGKEYRLPSETEWEKAARGVDGRWFPWGSRFDPSLCNMSESLRERPVPVPVDEFPGDISVYRVRGTAGNVRDWTATDRVEGAGSNARVARVVRGGSWSTPRLISRCASRYWGDPLEVSDIVGLRLAVRPRGTR
jgi:serine/threonine-protein kinase